MSFFKSLERKVFRPVGRGLKAAAPVVGGVAGSFIPGVGNVVGSALGSAIGGQLKKGKFDAGSLLRDAGTGVLTGGVMSKLGGGSFLGGARGAAGSAVGDMASEPLMSSVKSAAVNVPGIGAQTLSTAPARNWMAEGALKAAAGGAKAGGLRSGLGEMLRDGKTIKAIGDTALGGYQAVQQNRQMQMERDQMNRRNRIEDDEIARRQALDPVRAQLLAAMFQRMGLNTGAV